MPEHSELYQIPSWPPTKIDRSFLNPILASIDDRLVTVEARAASFDALEAQGIQASLDYIQVNVAPQIANLQQSITLAQDQIDQIIIGGKAPDTLKFGGQLPAYYATAQALSGGLAAKVPNTRKVNNKELSADITLGKGDVGLGNVDNTADGDKPISTDQGAALAKRIRVDALQNFSEAEKGQARANIGGGVLSGFRNKIINGDFRIAQRGLTGTLFGSARYTFDRWFAQPVGGAQMSVAEITDANADNIAGLSQSKFAWINLSDTAGAGKLCTFSQKIEDVRTLANRKATFTVWAASSVSGKIALEITQIFGSGGSPQVIVGSKAFDVSPDGWTRCDFVVDIPSVAGKVLGTNHYLEANIWLSAGASWASRGAGIGEQTGERYIAHVSLVEGDATAEDDPFSPRHPQQELALCQRYYENIALRLGGDAFAMSAGEGRSASGTLFFKQRKRGSPNFLTNISSGNFQNSSTSPAANAWGVGCTGLGFSTTSGTVSISLYGGSADYLVINVLSTQIFSPVPNGFATGPGIYIAAEAEL